MAATIAPNAPLGKDMEEWDEFLQGRYQEGKSQEEFRQYDETANPGVAEFYRLNHQYQTHDYVMDKEKEYFGLKRGMKSIWESSGVSEHAGGRQRSGYGPDADRAPAADLGGDPQGWASEVVCADRLHPRPGQGALPAWRTTVGCRGRYLPVGCAYSDQIVFPEYFKANPDLHHPVYSAKYGIYEPNCGLDNVHMSFGCMTATSTR